MNTHPLLRKGDPRSGLKRPAFLRVFPPDVQDSVHRNPGFAPQEIFALNRFDARPASDDDRP